MFNIKRYIFYKESCFPVGGCDRALVREMVSPFDGVRVVAAARFLLSDRLRLMT